jgi:Family of unknown function (DUF6218)
MTTELTIESTTGLIPTRAVDGRTMIGHTVVCQGQGDDQDLIAVWHVSTEGINTGAWTLPVSAVYEDPRTARMLLDRCLRHAIVAWEPSIPVALLSTLELAANVGARDWSTSVIALPQLLSEIDEIRSTLEKLVVDEQQSKKNVVALEWAVDLPDPLPADANEFQRFAGLIGSSGCPVVQEALQLSNLVRWCIQRWQETLTMARRRACLQQSLEELGVLPPRWESHLADAYALLR